MKINKILAAVDSSAHSIACAEYASYIAESLNAGLTAMHVIDILQLEGPFMYDISGALGFEPFINFSNQIRKALEEKGNNVLSSFESIASRRNIKIEKIMELGVISSMIVDKSSLYDMVFVGRKGVNAAYERGILGSNIEPIVRKINKPLFISEEKFYEINNIIVGYDNSDVAKKALEYAVYLSKYLHSSVTAVSVSQDENKSKDILDNISDNIIHKESIQSKDVSNTLVKFVKSKKNPLLCMGAYSKSKVIEIILGSTTESVLRQRIEFPLLIAR